MPEAITLETYAVAHSDGIKALWWESSEINPPAAADDAISAKLAVQPELLIVALEGATVVGSIMPGYDGHRGWLYALAVLESHRRQGIGTLLVREAERRLRALGCTKINLQVRSTNSAVTEFYAKLGYSVEERISMGKRVEP